MIDTASLLTSKSNGWWTIITGAFLHGSPGHFAGNSVGLMVGVTLLLNFYSRSYWKVIIIGLLAPSIVMYSTGLRSLGISGLVFAIAWFIMFRGLLSMDRKRYYAAIVMLLFYGSTLKSVFHIPFSGVAFQAHMTGLLVGLFLAIYTRLQLSRKH